MAEVSQVWMYDRNIIFGKNIDSYFFDGVLEYMKDKAVNKVEKDFERRELRTIDISHPDEVKVLVNEDIIERMKREVEYDVRLRSAVFMSSEYLLSDQVRMKGYYSRKNKLQNDDYDRFLSRIGQVSNNKFYFQIDTDGLTKENLKEIEIMLQQAKEEGFDIQVVCFRGVLEKINERTLYVYNEKEFKLLDKLNRICLKQTGRELLHQRAPSSIDIKKWKHSAVVEANLKLDKVAKDIFALGLSPLETMSVVHRYCSSFTYNDFETDAEETRTIVGLLANGEEFPQAVCPAFATLEKAIVDKLNQMGMKGLEAQVEFYKIFYEDMAKEILHCYNLIKINDPKYNVSGLYADDPTKDAPSPDAPMQQAYSFFMVPISDLNKMARVVKITDTGIKYAGEASDIALSMPFLKTLGMPKQMAQKVFEEELEIENNTPYKVLTMSGRGRPISYKVLKSAIMQSYKKMMPDNKNINNIIAYELAVSMLFAESNFNDNASSCLVKKVKSLSQEEYEDLQKYAFGKIVIDRNGNLIEDEDSENEEIKKFIN